MNNLQQTSPNKFVGILRILLGIIFVMTGLMKLFMADYAEAWSIQLTEAEIPLYTFNYWFVPILETLLGLFLFLGYHSRISAFLVLPIMLVAIYVHLTVTDPGAFPSQPQEPYMPIVIILMALVIIIKGAGNWSMDLKSNG
ncbi:MAG: DoxX family protein [Bacteroidetes bacterium]|nr:MAG: DoxX family protein [Bacteroidota bacterium]TDI79070.1 MAG: DoxX family protein [Bacteroidota bacterium]